MLYVMVLKVILWWKREIKRQNTNHKQNFSFSSNFKSWVFLRTQYVKLEGITSVPYGGQNSDILFTPGNEVILNIETGEPEFENSNNSYLFIISDIGAKHVKNSRHNV